MGWPFWAGSRHENCDDHPRANDAVTFASNRDSMEQGEGES